MLQVQPRASRGISRSQATGIPFFRGLRNIRKNDEITLTTLTGTYRYRVDSTRVVEPDDTRVLDASAEPA